jgi:A/G-specific adenine glycosylase
MIQTPSSSSCPETWTTKNLSLLRRRATAWFRKNGRVLPWRMTRDPYSIWVSEIMLQQTQVATVIPYYHRFLDSFPTVIALANASLDDVYEHWSGLGYYRRARQLHAAAQVVVEQHDGLFPTNYADVRSLPGIGQYTAGAILSFATDARLPIVEANTQRLYARLLHLQLETSSSLAQAQLWGFAEAVLPQKSINRSWRLVLKSVCPRAHCVFCALCRVCVPPRQVACKPRFQYLRKPRNTSSCMRWHW